MLPENNEKYGRLIQRFPLDNGEKTFAVSEIESRGEEWLDIRSVYYKNNEPRFGKGVRLPMSMAEDLAMIITALSQEE